MGEEVYESKYLPNSPVPSPTLPLPGILQFKEK